MLFKSHAKYSRAYSERGLARYQLGELSKAMDDFEQAIILDSSNALAFEGRAITRLELGDWQDAMNDLDESIRLEVGRSWQPTSTLRKYFPPVQETAIKLQLIIVLLAMWLQKLPHEGLEPRG